MKRAIGLGILVFVVVALVAWKAPGDLDARFTVSFIIAFILMTMFLVFTIWAIVKRGEALDRATEAEAAANFSSLLLDQNPNAFLVLFQDGTCFCSDRFREWLGLAHAATRLEELAATEAGGGLARAELNRLTEALGQLDEAGAPFTVSLRAAATGKSLIASGSRVDREEAGGIFDLVWFSDISENANDIDRLQAELGAVKTRHGQFADILDAAPFPIWVRDSSLDLQWVNQAYVRAVNEKVGKKVVREQIELCANPLGNSARDGARDARRGKGAARQRQYAVIDGERRALDIFDVPVRNGEGIVGFALDMTDAERTRSELHMYLESQSETLNRLSTPVAIFAPDTTLSYFNSAFSRLWQLPDKWLSENPTHSELLETLRDRRKLPEQADFPAWKKQILDRYTGLLEAAEEMWHLPDDTALRVVTQPHPLGGLLVLFEDVTDRLALERSYNTLIAVQRETLDNLHEAVAVIGGDLRIKLYNPNFARVLGLDEGYLAQGPHYGDMLEKCRDLLSVEGGDWQARKEEIIGHSLRHEQSTGIWALQNGNVYEFAVVSLPDGASLLTMTDVTDSARIEQALRERGEALETADRLKSEFIASMSYELRTPLNSILGFSEMLEDGYFGELNERQLEYVDGIVVSSRLLRDLIDDILDLAVIEAGELSLEVSEFDLSEAVRSVAALVQDRARMKNIEIRTRCQRNLGTVAGDARRIKHAFYNVLLNAISYTPDRGRITVSAKGDASAVQISVADTGIGISEEDRGLIFEKFRRGSNTGGSTKGVGLGLALVRSFIELHGGNVELRSRPGEGTTVTFELPRTIPVLDEGGAAPSTEAAESGATQPRQSQPQRRRA